MASRRNPCDTPADAIRTTSIPSHYIGLRRVQPLYAWPTRHREEFFRATKCGAYLDATGRAVKNHSPSGLTATIDGSRWGLRIDVIDIVQFHGLPGQHDDSESGKQETMTALPPASFH